MTIDKIPSVNVRKCLRKRFVGVENSNPNLEVIGLNLSWNQEVWHFPTLFISLIKSISNDNSCQIYWLFSIKLTMLMSYRNFPA
jgi:hypothetical protein